MSQETKFELTYPPSVNKAYMRTRDGKVVLARHVKEWRTTAGWAYKAAGGKMLEETQPVSVEVELHPPDNRKRDIDNGLKSLLDALNGVAWKDDSQVIYLTVAKYPCTGAGRVDVTVREIKRPG